ncbi:MAG: hypothetical protein FWD12_08495 [Alphaproteobacteria bacterium]|nr:hypothetical protein [Alphaproteobacteria bacterium]
MLGRLFRTVRKAAPGLELRIAFGPEEAPPSLAARLWAMNAALRMARWIAEEVEKRFSDDDFKPLEPLERAPIEKGAG